MPASAQTWRRGFTFAATTEGGVGTAYHRRDAVQSGCQTRSRRLLVAGPSKGAVEIIHIDARCVRMSTLDGHLEAGAIEFGFAEAKAAPAVSG